MTRWAACYGTVNYPVYSENWVQDIIADDPSILGLGDLILRDRERIQTRAGRLDLLLQDPETYKLYEVELQLGATDETHTIRSVLSCVDGPGFTRVDLSCYR